VRRLLQKLLIFFFFLSIFSCSSFNQKTQNSNFTDVANTEDQATVCEVRITIKGVKANGQFLCRFSNFSGLSNNPNELERAAIVRLIVKRRFCDEYSACVSDEGYSTTVLLQKYKDGSKGQSGYDCYVFIPPRRLQRALLTWAFLDFSFTYSEFLNAVEQLRNNNEIHIGAETLIVNKRRFITHEKREFTTGNLIPPGW